ncbi:hypothetical protein K1718_13245 [Roseibium porphyridii]|uniref:Histone H2A/H2B/H3 domain-containing protein n=1 Tax=Roseibium porphyridii TaxID=2866279 RepID=A0ABY8FGB3_9HYPH|nr:hypothetical protein [Roseibium sp. KMA01]WFE92285.1 hypothetical protein K1718_13245 [Roseibium sp. KMA01]
MSLSSDLKMLFDQLDQRKSSSGELHLSAATVELVEFVFRDAIQLARQLEANAVRRDPVVLDLSDPKIEVFPKAKRPKVVPIRPTDDGGAA